MSNKKSISNSFSVSTIEDGAQGKRGRFYYYAGNWDDFASGATFLVSDSQMPFFSVIRDGQTRYYVFNPEQNKIYTKSEMGNPSNNTPWEIMTNDFKYLITEAIFSNFAHLGGAIISGDWMISQYGTINGQTSQNFQAFDSQHPNDNVVTNFIPNFCVNLNTGDSYQQNAYIAGSLFTESVRTKFVTIPDNCRRLYVGLSQEQVDLYDPYPYPQSNYINMGYDDAWNFLLPSNSEIEVILCMNSNALHGQRVLLYNSHAVTAGGTASATILRSCEVSLMYDEHDDEHYVEWSYYPFRGVVTNENASQGNEYDPSQIDTYDPVYTIEFVNGVVEIMCVPRNADNLHDWCVINIGSNCFALNPLRT